MTTDLRLPVFPDAFRAPVRSAEIIAVGTELTQGLIVNSNASWLCARLLALGVPVHVYTTLSDHLDLLADEIRRAAERTDLVVLTGGLGPTRDDLTRDAIARAASVDLVLDPESLEHIETLFKNRLRHPMAENNRQQAYIPAGALALHNPIGTAPGIACLVGSARVLAFPGVPRELFAMFDHVANLLAQSPEPPGAIAVRTLHCFGTGESDVDRRIRDLMDPHANPFVAITVVDSIISVRITAAAPDREHAQALVEPVEDDLRTRLGDLIFGTDDQTLPSVTAQALLQSRRTLALAESCTAGLLASTLAETPGISTSLLEAVVTYANAAKVRLGVPEELIREHGAVSHEVAVALAETVRARANADVALGITGIAGPTGGSPEKPVGLVYIALASTLGTEVRRLQLFGDRNMVRKRAMLNACNLLRLTLAKLAAT